MSPTHWLVWRELTRRRSRFALSAGVVAAAVTLVSGVELLSRARESAVAAELDRIGPPLQIVPQGVTSSAAARLDLGGELLPAGIEDRIRGALPQLRQLQRRLVSAGLVAGRQAPLVGVDSGATRDLSPGEVALGSALAEQLGASPGGRVQVEEETYRIAAVLQPSDSAEDIAAFLPLEKVQALARASGGVNELRLTLRPGAHPAQAETMLQALKLPASVIRSSRGEVADGALQGSIERHRLSLYGVLAAVAGLCLFISALLDVLERRVELSTLAAVGTPRDALLGVIVGRSALVGAGGGLVGLALGAGFALAQGSGAGLSGLGELALLVLGATLALGALAATPAGLAIVRRDPVRDLQANES